jgi:hypothetical protein
MEGMSTGWKRSATSNTENRLRNGWMLEADIRGTGLYGPRDIRFEARLEPAILGRRMPSSESQPHACAATTFGLLGHQ